jgi:acyl-CoA synthetase (AMP-forming)/AMP-acid ligase II
VLKFALNTDPPKLDPAASGPTGAIDTVCSIVYSRLVNYKIPQVMRVVDHIPRNAMGKINKKELVKSVFKDDHSGDEM